jgi:hypothetical protein
MRTFVSAFVFVVLALSAPFAHAAPMAAVTFSSLPTQFPVGPSGDQTEGYSFTTNKAITIDALGALFGTNPTVHVRLYDSSQTQLRSATVSSSDPVDSQTGLFHMHTIMPVSLAAGQTYYVVADLVQGDKFGAGATGITTNPAISYGQPVGGVPTNATPLNGMNLAGTSNGNFGPNFEIAPAPTPEPTTAVAFGLLAVTGAGYIRRRLKPASD